MPSTTFINWCIAIVLLHSATLFADTSENKPISQSEQRTLVERVVSFWNVGGARPEPGGYYKPWYITRDGGWEQFIQQRIEPEYEWGVRRWLIHNPFGRPYGPMAFDQHLLAPERGFDWLVEGFEEAWSEFFNRHPDTEVIFYLGKLHGQERFETHLPERPDLWMERVLKSSAPVLRLHELGASIAFDAASPAPEGSPTHRFVELITRMGVRTYIESWPHRRNAHWGDHNVIVAEKRRGVFATGGAGVPRERITGRILWLLNANLAKTYPEQPQFDKRTPEGLFNIARGLLSLDPEYDIGAPVFQWMRKGLDFQSLASPPLRFE
ncbi:MAG: hypothetical protein K9N51_03740 [Candidatus Pacebacteria bacterium]|nr:hypothetical protein [Candidatus Paceibacterota bacterium]